MNSVRLSVIVASKGRVTLPGTLQSIAFQLEPGDELLVDINTDPWGNAGRQRMLDKAAGTHVMFCDDDDEVLPGALAVIRQKCDLAPDCVHFFRHRRADNGVLWWPDDSFKQVVRGWVSTQMVVAPNRPGKLGRWEPYEDNGADAEFIKATVALWGGPERTRWHDDVIQVIRPHGSS